MPSAKEVGSYRNPSLATDIIIEYGRGGKQGIVLIERRNPPYGLALPGGFHEYGLSAVENARKEAREETGLELSLLDDPNQPFMVRSDPERDPRGHVVTIVYRAKGIGDLCAGDDAVEADVYTIPEVKGLIHEGRLAFDHDETLLVYLQDAGHFVDLQKSRLGSVGVIGRFKPLHNRHAAFLGELCRRAQRVVIGIGSSNRYNSRNPFTAEETEQMIHAVLAEHSNYSIVKIPDFGHMPEHVDGSRWAEEVGRQFGNLDFMVSGNPYVADLLKDCVDYRILHPIEVMSKDQWGHMHAKKIRLMIVNDEDWRELVPDVIATYIDSNGLADRMRDEFGEEILEMADDLMLERADGEKKTITGGGT